MVEARAAADVSAVHLVWQPLGTEVLQRFVASYRRHQAGARHRLLVVFNGFAPGADRGAWRAELDGVAHDELVLTRPVLDLAAYRIALDDLAGGHVCFLNSYTRLEANDWLAKLTASLGPPEVGLVGAGGSFESARTAAPALLRPLLGRGFPGFPNPHVRTNGFALEPALARALDWPPPRRKREAHLLESGWHSITRQVLDHGLGVLVVGADGTGYPPERWRESATFRSGGQRNRLLSDNRTQQYADADPAFRATLERMCWGQQCQ